MCCLNKPERRHGRRLIGAPCSQPAPHSGKGVARQPCRPSAHTPLPPPPATQYTVSVEAKLASGTAVAATKTLDFTTPACGGPTIVDADPTSPTSGRIVLDPPANATGPVDYYKVVLCPRDGGACIEQTCPTATCDVSGLTPNTVYDVTAEAVIDGQTTPASNTAELVTPPVGAPALTAADDTTCTTAYATATPAPGTSPTSYTFTFAPASGGTPVTVTTTARSVNVTGLLPATQYEVTVVARSAGGSSTPPSNTITFVTPVW